MIFPSVSIPRFIAEMDPGYWGRGVQKLGTKGLSGLY